MTLWWLFMIASAADYGRDALFVAQVQSYGATVVFEPNLSRLGSIEKAVALLTEGIPRVTSLQFPWFSTVDATRVSPQSFVWPSTLRHVDLSFSRIDDSQLEEVLTYLPQGIHSLTLRGTCLQDRHIRIIASSRCRHTLEDLDIGFSGVTSDGAESLTGLSGLVRFSCPITLFDDESLANIEKIKSLRGLNIAGTRITAIGLAARSALLENLRTLDLSGMASLGDDELKTLLAASPNVQTLELTRTRVSNSSLLTLLSHRRLNSINIAEAAVRLDEFDFSAEIPDFQHKTIYVDHANIGGLPFATSSKTFDTTGGRLFVVITPLDSSYLNPENIALWTHVRSTKQ